MNSYTSLTNRKFEATRTAHSGKYNRQRAQTNQNPFRTTSMFKSASNSNVWWVEGVGPQFAKETKVFTVSTSYGGNDSTMGRTQG